APVSAPTQAPVTAPGSAQTPVTAPVSAPAQAGGYVVQVGAVSDQARAQQYQQRLGQQFGVPGRVEQNGAVWRIQLGPFASKSEAAALQQRLQNEAQLQSFIAVAK
ncbi:MAG TPA: endolytic peptidoglycan transglycosylase RlpA, partial [Leclercia adecarboxylata]|nr:endolytic peptidoglycan transglycosylase RlpA [Leclercia adecarboxylata]